MNKHKIIITILILSLTYSVTCDDAEEVKLRGLNRARQQYRYNHPPAAEYYESIPVAVVYDKMIDRTSRRRKLEPETESSLSSPELAVTSVPELNKEEKVTIIEHSTIAASIVTKNTKQPESRNVKLSFMIPVSVVYDEEPGDVKRNGVKSRVSTRLRKTNKRERKPSDELNERYESTVRPTKEIDEKDKSEAKLTRGTIEKDFLDYNSQLEKPKTEMSRSRVPAGNSRRRIQAKKLERDISKESKVNATQESPKLVTVTEISNLKESTEYASQEKPSQAVMTETSNTIISARNTTGQKIEHGEPDPIVPIVASENRVFGHNGEFRYSYEGGDGTKAFSKGKLKTFDEEVAGEAVEGGFSYKDKDGNDFSLSYTADENGYRPIGAHLPTPPPIPPAIARALAYLATKTTPEQVTEAIDDQENTPVQNETVKQRN